MHLPAKVNHLSVQTFTAIKTLSDSDTVTVFFNCLHNFFLLVLFFQNFTHKSKNCTHKMPRFSCKMKHCFQNITNTSQKHTFVSCCKHFCHYITFLYISYTHSYSKPELLCTFLYKIESKWQR